jgi:DNA gyrase inhibitor GyrI
MIKTAVLTVLAMVIVLAIYLYSYLGVSKSVTVTLEPRGPLHLVFKTHLGPYHQILPRIQEVEAWAHEHNLNCTVTFGEYLDDPQNMDEDRLRSRGGCVLRGAPAVPPPPEFQYQVRAERSYAIGHFDGSPAIGPYKVYPKVQKFLGERRLKSTAPVMELYTVNGPEIQTEYLFAVDNAP